MASQKPYVSASEGELSDVQVLDSDEPLVTASSSVPSLSSARVMDSIEPLVPTTRVQVLDSNEPLVLPCVRSSVLDGSVAGPSGMAGPSGAGSSGSPPAIASDSEDEDEPIVAAMPRPCGSSGRRVNPYSDELRSMWNWRKIYSTFSSNDQCIQFAEERGLIPTQKMCSIHHKLMSLTKEAGQLGKFRCRKSNCRTKGVSRAIGTWFEDARLSLTFIFQIMYAFSAGLTYHQTRKELASDDVPVLSTRTVSDWFSYCRETITLYEIENRAQGKIGGPKKLVQMKKQFRQHQNKQYFSDWLCEYVWRRRIMARHLDAYEELINAIKFVYHTE